MEGRKFSSSAAVVIYVRDFLSRYEPTRCATSSPSPARRHQDTDFTWAEFVRRNNDELVAGWGNLVNRSISMAAQELRRDPGGRRADRRRPRAAGHGRRPASTRSATCSAARGRRRPSARRCGWSARPTSTSPTRRRGSSRTTRTGMGTVLHVALQAVQDCNTLLTPFLPHSAQTVHEALGGDRACSADAARSARSTTSTAARATRSSPATTPGGAAWEHVADRRRHAAGTRRRRCSRKLDPSVVDEELARLARLIVRTAPARVDRRLDRRAAAPPAARAAAGPGARQPLPPRHRCATGRARPSARVASARRAAVGVTGMVQVGCDLPSSRWSVELAATAPGGARRRSRCTRTRRPGSRLGGRPGRGAATRSRRWPRSPGCAAIGETGLDYFRTGDDGRAAQEESLPARTSPWPSGTARRWSSTTGTPTTTCSGCWTTRARPDTVVFHCFSGDAAFAARLRPTAATCSAFAGTVTFKNAREPAGRGCASTPLDQLLVETDAPFLTPMPYRGRPNALVPDPADRPGAGRDASGATLDELCAGISATGERVFGPW